MPRYFFHLARELMANDVLGHDCVDESEAKKHASFIPHRIGTERPEMIGDENVIVIVNRAGDEIDRIPLASTMA